MIQFKAKIETWYCTDDKKESVKRIKFPKLTTSHCDMNKFRSHKKYGSYANSDIFPAMLQRIKTKIMGEYNEYLKLEALPKGVTIDDSGFLAVVNINLDEIEGN